MLVVEFQTSILNIPGRKTVAPSPDDPEVEIEASQEKICQQFGGQSR